MPMGLGPGNRCCTGDPPTCIAQQCGRILGCNALPLAGATVVLTWIGGGASLTTDADGRYCFDNPATPTSGDIDVDYTVTYPGLETATGTFTVSCLTPGTVDDIQLTTDSEHVCVCGCPNPLPKSLPITTPVASGTLVYSGSGTWVVTLTWTDSQAVRLVTGTSDIGGHCNCVVSAPGPVMGIYSLHCVSGTDAYGNPAPTWTLTATMPGYIMRKPVKGSAADNDCYQTVPSGAFTPFCDTHGSTSADYDIFHLGNTDYGTPPNSICNWTDTLSADCDAATLDFSASLNVLCGTDIPDSATVTP